MMPWVGGSTEISVGSLNSLCIRVQFVQRRCLTSMALFGLLKITNQLCFPFQRGVASSKPPTSQKLYVKREGFCFCFFKDGRDLRIFISEKASSKVNAEDTGIEELIVGTRF